MTGKCDFHQQRCCKQCLTGQRIDENVCVDCPAGFRCTDSVKYLTAPCEAGTYSGNRDAVCDRCAIGKSCTRRKMSSPEICPDGINCNNPAMLFPCPAGYKCVRGNIDPCGEGTWSPEGQNL